MRVITQKIEKTWRVEHDDKRYRIQRTDYVGDGETRTGYWVVWADMRNQDRYCDPDRPTHKRVVQALQQEIKWKLEK
jgi:hypothetical protein